MLNILYIFGGEKASGAERVMERLINHNLDAVSPHLFIAPGDYAYGLQASGHNKYPIHLVEALKKLNRSGKGKLKFYWQAIVNNLKVSFLVIKYVHKNDIRIVHANTIVPAFYLFPAVIYFRLFKKRIKFIWSDHDLRYFSTFDHKLASTAYALYHRTITVSNAVKNKYPRSEKVVTLYNGVNLNEFKSDLNSAARFREKWAFKNDEILIGIVATIEPRKGQLELINAFAALVTTKSDIRLILAGPLSTDDAQYTEAVLNAVGTGKHVKYLGKVNDMPELYNGCDIIVNNSNVNGSEPLGTTLYEAMAVKKIVIASNTGGSPEIIEDEKDGFLFKCGDVHALFNKLEQVVTRLGSLDFMRENARAKVIRKFNIDTMIDCYDTIISTLLK